MSENTLEEAGVQFSFKALSPNGFSHLFVWRDDEGDLESLVDLALETETMIVGRGFTPLANGYDRVSYPLGKGPDGAPSPAAENGSSFGGQRSGTGNKWAKYYPEYQGPTLKTGRVTKIMVELADNDRKRVTFHIDNRRLPIYAYDVGERLVQDLFKKECWSDDDDPDPTWTRDMLDEIDVIYTPKHFGELVALSGKKKDTEEKKGYWDIIGVKPKGT